MPEFIKPTSRDYNEIRVIVGMDQVEKDLLSTHAVYHRILQPAYERMIVQNVYRNKIRLKSGASAQLLHKRPKTTGYLSKSVDENNFPAASTCRNASVIDSYHWQKSIPPSRVLSAGFTQDARSPVHPLTTDEMNMKSSSRANSFSATTRVREVPVSTIYKKEIQEFRSRTPSARGVRAAAITNRSIVASQTAIGSSTYGQTVHPESRQQSRLEREHALLELTRQRKRRSQLLSHRIDRMYYMLGSPSKIHNKYDVTEDDLDKLRAIAISRGMKIPSYSSYSKQRPSTTSGPHSTPRGEEEAEDDLDRVESGKTIIPTADTLSVTGDMSSSLDKNEIKVEKEDRSTSDHEEDGCGEEKVLSAEEDASFKIINEKDSNLAEQDHLSVKSDSAVLKDDVTQRSVTFVTEEDPS